MKILIVDDNQDAKMILKKTLESDGYDVDEASDGEKALSRVKTSRPDMIISDILMPVMDGFKLCRIVKGDERLKHIPFVFYTATYTDAKDEELALKLGADRYIRKPVKPDKFVKIIREVIKAAENGEIQPKVAQIEYGEDIFKLYDERLVKKLEKKMLELQKEISERKKAEEKLKESEERYRSVFQNTGAATVIIEADMTLSTVNSEFENMSGYSKDELEGKKRWTEFVVREDLERMQEFHTKRRENGYEVPRDYEFQFVDRLGIVKNTLVKVGMIPGTKKSVASLIDITQRKKTEESLRESREKYKDIFNNIVDIFYRTDNEGRITIVSPSIKEVFGLAPEEVIGKKLATFYVYPQQREEFLALLKAKGWVKGYETEMKTKDGSVVWVSTDATFYRNENGDILGVQGISRDITEYKKTEDKKRKLESKLQQAQKMEAIGTLAGGVAHDFNNFLTIILGNADLMLIDLRKDHPFYKNLNEISKAGKGAASLTRQLLAFSRKQIIQPEIMNLNDVINTTIKMLGRLIGENVELRTFLDPDLDLVQIDSGQMEQVIINLAVNARDAMPGGGKLTVETKNLDLDEHFFKSQGLEGKVGPHVMLRVSDTGIGMDEKILPHIFDPFFTTKGIERGTGLGLSTVYGIVKQNNGYIFVQSQPGKGSAFDIYLPAAKMVKKPVTAEMISEDGLTGSETILVVEDDQILQRLTSRVLEHYGYRVLKAPNGDEALKVSQEHEGPIHLILTDVIMPGMNVREMAERIQSRRKESKVLYMSGYTDETISWYGVLKPGIHFLEKPFTPERLARKGREVLNRKIED